MQEKSWTEEDLSYPKLCHFSGEVQLKSSFSSYPLQCAPIHILTFAIMVISLETWASIKALLSMGNYIRQCFQVFLDLSQEGLESQCPHPGLRSVCLLSNKQDSSLVPWRLMLDPTPPSNTLLSVDGCLIFVVERGFKYDRYLMLSWWWHHSFINTYFKY